VNERTTHEPFRHFHLYVFADLLPCQPERREKAPVENLVGTRRNFVVPLPTTGDTVPTLNKQLCVAVPGHLRDHYTVEMRRS